MFSPYSSHSFQLAYGKVEIIEDCLPLISELIAVSILWGLFFFSFLFCCLGFVGFVFFFLPPPCIYIHGEKIIYIHLYSESHCFDCFKLSSFVSTCLPALFRKKVFYFSSMHNI